MPPSAAGSKTLEPPFQLESYLTPRRIRHITGVQIRNFTPFPVRDSFTSALSLPLEQSHLPPGIADDLVSVLSKKRSRKVSTNSTTTRRSANKDDSVDLDLPSPAEIKGKVSSSAVVFASSSTVSTSPNNGNPFSYKHPHSLRGRRRRTSSATSFGSSRLTEQNHDPLATFSISSFLPDHSQAALQKVIHSRLIETFITISLPSNLSAGAESRQEGPRSPGSVPMKEFPMTSRAYTRPPLSYNHEVSPKTRSSAPHPESAPPTRSFFNHSNGNKGENKAGRAKPHDLETVGSYIPSQHKGKMTHNPAQEMDLKRESGQSSSIYVSPIHRPSTNPLFSIDARSGCDFPRGVDTGGQRLRIEIWGRISSAEILNHQVSVKSNTAGLRGETHGWKMIEAWDITLSDLRPLPGNIVADPSLLPSNTLLITLSPPDQVFYLPNTFTAPRTPSPTSGYTSDPESEIRRAKQQDRGTHQDDFHEDIQPLSRRRGRKHLIGSATFTAKTATSQQLFKLADVQSHILDNEASLNEVIRKMDKVFETGDVFRLRRQISERELRIEELQQNRTIVFQECQRRREEIIDRSERLKKRNELLSLAKRDIQKHPELDITLEADRRQLEILQQKISSMRTSLLSILATIFPIELYSPPDLLFTILDVPLPIPLTAADPAPPLTMAEHKEVTEESVATALGYAAQVLQILAVYLGRDLVYPVTCIGSRSLIRDGISAMVGPRMFPLFSKGVDTYRFEYGVFLLNKNIELFMSERDLRALDIRHTLPNLKNLILTLTHDTTPKPQSVCHPYSPMLLHSGLKTPSRESSPVREDISTPKATHSHVSLIEGVTPSASGTTTPTTAGMLDDSRKSKSFLGFVPFGDFLRSRYPSTGQPSDKRNGSTGVVSEDVVEIVDPDEDDRTTIHGISLDKNDKFPEEAAKGDGNSTGTFVLS